MSRLIMILMMLPALMYGQVEYYKSFPNDTTTGRDTIYGFSWRYFGLTAPAPWNNIVIPDPIYSGFTATINHWYSAGTATVEITKSDSSSMTRNGSLSASGTQSPTDFPDEVTNRGITIASAYDTLEVYIKGLTPNTTYDVSTVCASQAWGTNDFQIRTVDGEWDYTNARNNSTYSSDFTATTDGNGDFWYQIVPINTGAFGPELRHFGLLIFNQ